MDNIEGQLFSEKFRFVIISSRFNSFIVEKLHEGAKSCLLRHRTKPENITSIWVPGSFEIPLSVKWALETKKFDAAIALGAVFRGATSHFDYVASEAAKGIAQVSLQTGFPVSFGILTTDTIEQAIERAGAKAGNKGVEKNVLYGSGKGIFQEGQKKPRSCFL